jgi:Glycosyl transferase family 2
MERLYVRSYGYTKYTWGNSMFQLKNIEQQIIDRGVHLFFIDSDLNFTSFIYDTYQTNYEKEIMSVIKKNYETSTIYLIVLLMHDDCTNKISVVNMHSQLSFLGIKHFKNIKFRGKYFFIYDNLNKSMLEEIYDLDFPIDKVFYINQNTNRIINRKINIVCPLYLFNFYEEYVKSFSHVFNLTLLIENDIYKINYQQSESYIFVNKFPMKFKELPNIYFWNTEQLTVSKNLDKINTLHNIPILDYSTLNLSLMVNHKPTYYLPYQYNDTEIITLKFLISKNQKLYDVAFCGLVTPKRQFILDLLKNNNIKVNIICEKWNYERDIEISKAKILLNIHADDNSHIYESIRCDRWAFAGMIVISEDCLDQNELDINHLIQFTKYEHLVNKIIETINHYDETYDHFSKQYNDFINEIKKNRLLTAYNFIVSSSDKNIVKQEKNLSPKLGLAITTYSDSQTPNERIQIIDQSLNSLKKTLNDNIYVIIVVDGSYNQYHETVLNKYIHDFNIYIKPINGGIAKAKNTSIRKLLNIGCDILFLADDDIIYHHDWYQFYSQKMIQSKIPFLSFVQCKYRVGEKRIINNVNVLIADNCFQGCFMIINKSIIEKVGYFDNLPNKYGYEHVIFNKRLLYLKIITHNYDLVDSEKYIELNAASHHIKSINKNGFDPEINSKYLENYKKPFVPFSE